MGGAINTMHKSKSDRGKKSKAKGKSYFPKKTCSKEANKKGSTEPKLVERTTNFV